MNYISHTGHKLSVAHFPGNTRDLHADFIQKAKEKTVTKPDNITIVSVITDNVADNACLKYQLDKSGIEFVNPIENKIINWNMTSRKIEFIIDALKGVDTEYTLILDGTDVVLLDDLDRVTECLDYYNKDIVFNATVWRYPAVNVDFVENRWQYGEYNYLNAGCCVGKTDELIKFYQEVYDNYMLTRSKEDFANSEQFFVRRIFDKHQDRVFFDYDCVTFQIWHKQETTINGDNCYLR